MMLRHELNGLVKRKQHIATGWPNVRNMLCPTMLQDVALKCCERFSLEVRHWKPRGKKHEHGLAPKELLLILLSPKYLKILGTRAFTPAGPGPSQRNKLPSNSEFKEARNNFSSVFQSNEHILSLDTVRVIIPRRNLARVLSTHRRYLTLYFPPK